MEVTVGTYEGFVLGYKVSKRKSSWSLKIVFADKCHMNAVKTVASSGPIIASGSIDETIAVFNILKRKCVTVLQEHSATVTSIRFHGNNAFTCSEDGRIVVWDSKNWLPKAELPGHVGAVKDFAVHPSGKLGLSVGQDKTLRTWNLLKGRNAYVTNIKAVAHLVVYSPDGRYYAIALHDTVEVFSIETAGSVQTLRSEAERRISDLKFTPDGKEIVFSSDSPTIEFHDANFDEKSQRSRKLSAHEPRVKAFAFGDVLLSEQKQRLLLTCGTEGEIKLWSYSATNLPSLLTSVNTKCRLTCLVLSELSENVESDGEDESVTAVSQKSVANLQKSVGYSNQSSTSSGKLTKAKNRRKRHLFEPGLFLSTNHRANLRFWKLAHDSRRSAINGH